MLSSLRHKVDAPGQTALLADEVEYIHIAFSNMAALFDLELRGSKLTNHTRDIRPVLTGLTARFQTLADARKVTVEVSSESDPILVCHDPIALEQSLGNLTYNAIVHARAHVALTVSTNAETVIIKILDDGPDVGLIDLKQLADPGYRRALEYRINCAGWALCLAITHELVQLHGGVLSIATESEDVTCVSVQLPIVSAGVSQTPSARLPRPINA